MKNWFQLLATAWISVTRHKLRSSLTILGVVIGVASVITLMSIGRGTQSAIVSQLENLGSNLLFISPGSTFAGAGGVRGGAGSSSTLTMEDAIAIAQEVPDIATIAPSSSASMQVISATEGTNTRTSITGVTLEYQQVLDLQITEGDFISQGDYDAASRVAVLGPTVATDLFNENDPIGQSLRMGNISVTVIGVLQSKGQSMLGSTDGSILIPLTTLQRAVAQPLTASGGHVVNSIMVAATDKNHMTDVKNNITGLLQTRHNIDISAANDFSITSQQDLANTISQATGALTLLLGAIAGISLLVGGIGVMNIMLVSVVERTREIGIRKALGAQERDIWGQFLIEAALLTLTGGIIGITLGWGLSLVVARFTQMPTLVSADIVIMAVSVSIGIGLFFGFYPAWQASRLNPIEALRAE